MCFVFEAIFRLHFDSFYFYIGTHYAVLLFTSFGRPLHSASAHTQTVIWKSNHMRNVQWSKLNVLTVSNYIRSNWNAQLTRNGCVFVSLSPNYKELMFMKTAWDKYHAVLLMWRDVYLLRTWEMIYETKLKWFCNRLNALQFTNVWDFLLNFAKNLLHNCDDEFFRRGFFFLP